MSGKMDRNDPSRRHPVPQQLTRYGLTAFWASGAYGRGGSSPGSLAMAGLNLMGGSILEFEIGEPRDHILITC